MNDLLLKIDEVAERILSLDYTPKLNYAGYCIISKIKESVFVSDVVKAVEDILTSFQTILILQRERLAISAEAGNEGTTALMSDNIGLQEKLIWMYSSFLNK